MKHREVICTSNYYNSGDIKIQFQSHCMPVYYTMMSEVSPLYVTESTKTGLIAHRQVLRKAGFNYSKCCSSPMAEATSIEFSHIIQQYLTFKTIL